MLGDRTYLLFKPRSNLPNDKLNIRQDSSTYGLSSNSYRSNPLSHSSSYERLSLKPTTNYSSTGTTPLPKRKFHNSGLTTTGLNSIYDNSYNDYSFTNTDYNTPRRRTATFSYNNANNFNTNIYPSSNYDRHKSSLQRSDSFGSTLGTSIGLFERSSNMEKREMLMSSFNRHTNTGDSNRQNWLNRLKLSNLFSSSPPKKILPPRPSSNLSYFNSNYGRLSNYSPYKTGSYRVNYLVYDDYYRPRIRDRPVFSDIRKSVMHKSGNHLKNNRYYANNYTNNYSNKFNKTNNINSVKSNASVLSNGSSGGLSSSSSGGSISYTQQSTTTSPSETSASFGSPLQSQKSIRKGKFC